MGATKVRNWWWTDFRHQYTRYRKKSPENSRAGALAYEATLRARLARGEDINKRPEVERKPPTFAEFAAEWFETYVKANLKPSTCRLTEMMLRRYLMPFFGARRLPSIGGLEVERYKAERLRSGVAPKTVNNELSALRSCLATAVRWGKLAAIPPVKWLKVPPQAFDFLSPDDAQRLVRGALGTSSHAMVVCALSTGMRLGELCGLEWSDVDLERRRIDVRRSCVRGFVGSPKSNRARHIPINDELHAVLLPLRRESGLVFPNANGRPFSSGVAWNRLDEVRKHAGIRSIGWHVLRHTFASSLVAQGVPIRAVQELLGHATIQMTERYSHLAPSTLHSAVALAGALVQRRGEFGHPVDNSLQSRPIAIEEKWQVFANV